MIPKHLIRVDIPTLSNDWFAFRTTGIDLEGQWYEGGIGASEIGSICSYDEYCPKAEVYGNKVGIMKSSSTDNAATIHGRVMEPHIIEQWRCEGGTPEESIIRYGKYVSTGDEKCFVKEAFLEKSYVINPKWPFLFISLDGAIAPGNVNRLTGEVLDHVCPLECKTISRYAARSYRKGYPDKYDWQIQQQMLVLEAEYGEIAILEDGRDFKIIPCEKNQWMHDKILEFGMDFWVNRVRPARLALALYYDAKASGDIKTREENWEIIQMLEPGPEGSDRYAEIKKDSYVEKVPAMNGSKELYALAHKYKSYHTVGKEIDKHKKELRGIFVKALADQQAKEISFGKGERLKFSKDMKLTVTVKDAMEKEEASRIVDGIKELE